MSVSEVLLLVLLFVLPFYGFVNLVEFRGCQVDNDCPPSQVCVNEKSYFKPKGEGRCLPLRQHHQDCVHSRQCIGQDNNFYCSSFGRCSCHKPRSKWIGRCVFDYECESDKHCNYGLKCDDGFCVFAFMTARQWSLLIGTTLVFSGVMIGASLWMKRDRHHNPYDRLKISSNTSKHNHVGIEMEKFANE